MRILPTLGQQAINSNNTDACEMPGHGQPDAVAPCCRVHSMEVSQIAKSAPPQFVWGDKHIWARAAKNTLVCLFGCSLGDIGVLIIAQVFWPHASMLIVMIAAIVAGLATSMLLESIILRVREGFPWHRAFRTAASMNLLSMIAMEVAMNLNDFALTGGSRMMSGVGWYVAALGVGAIVGFLAPLPYNYWMLKKHGRACH